MAKPKKARQVCDWRSQSDALRDFALFQGKVQSGMHIKPLHWHMACRLVIEGGFHPEEITPRPPFLVQKRQKKLFLVYDPANANNSERTVLGGLKTKSVDVVVTKESIGPVIAISCKGMTGALRNLTNRMEETVGESTNLHITYPSLVFGYAFLLRANRAQAQVAMNLSLDSETNRRALSENDIAIGSDDNPTASLVRFHYALCEMSGRRGIRNDFSRYESVALGVVDHDGSLLEYPPPDSAIRIGTFFKSLYNRYEERFVLNAPSLKGTTERRFWAPESPALLPGGLPSKIDYSSRVEL
jgi:hypothetical protein